jgi:ATP-dependent helicase/nuclease subunit A
MTPSDKKDRDEIVAEQKRNVVIDAGAGTGKTETLVQRYVAFLERGASIRRLAAITFTRRAAGELRFRIRELVLRRLSDTGSAKLREALGLLDEAPIGTIHSFADRLLRLHPVEAKLSPRYEIREETQDLVRLVTERLLRSGEPAIEDYLAAGLRAWSDDGGYQTKHGLDSLVSGLINSRDVVPKLQTPGEPDDAATRSGASSLLAKIRDSAPRSAPLQPFATDLEEIAATTDRRGLLRSLVEFSSGFKKELRQKTHFVKDDAGWALYKELKAARDTLTTPHYAEMVFRLVSQRPTILGYYEEIKRERELVDQTDLLIKLRDLLGDEGLRKEYAALFDHLFVDEFQDTDPVQSDILTALVRDADRPRPGSITIVGDPKQSIYRFRRADIEAYAAFRTWLTEAGALVRPLVCNFRSLKPLIDFFNARFPDILGTGPDFDPATGQVGYKALKDTQPGEPPSVLRVPFTGPDGADLKADSGRVVEADAIARTLRALHDEKRLHWGDVAVLSATTTTWPDYAPAFDRYGIPYAARGGQIFAKDPVVRSFILALRAVADPEDGVAAAAYYRPPFWLLTLRDLVDRTDAQSRAEEFLKDLRLKRTTSAPAQTARRLLEGTYARTLLDAGANGSLNLAKVEELIHVLDRRSREGLDLDAVTSELRAWIDAPGESELPEPMDADVVRFLTIHQAKGLEYPVVVVADSFQQGYRSNRSPWRINWEGTSAFLSLEGLSAELPAGGGLKEREKSFEDAELRRLVYVAATRARNLLILPSPLSKRPGSLLYAKLNTPMATLMRDAAAPTVPETPAWRPKPATIDVGIDLWRAGLPEAARPRTAPAAVTSLLEPELHEEGMEPKGKLLRNGRYGPVFGTVVHRVLALRISGAEGTPRELVDRVAREEGLEAHLAEAIQDVERAWTTLASLRGTRATEFPIAALQPDGRLVQGYIDLLIVSDRVHMIDFKTDAPGRYPMYESQVRTYARLLANCPAWAGRTFSAGLLFTATGDFQEVALQNT